MSEECNISIFVCKQCYTGENSLLVGEGVWTACVSCRCGAVLLTTAGQMLMTSSDLNSQPCPLQLTLRIVQTLLLERTDALNWCDPGMRHFGEYCLQFCPQPTGLVTTVCLPFAKVPHSSAAHCMVLAHVFGMLHCSRRAWKSEYSSQLESVCYLTFWSAFLYLSLNFWSILVWNYLIMIRKHLTYCTYFL